MTARKIEIADVASALVTCRSAAIAGSEGRKMLVASGPIAANAQITAMEAAILWLSDAGARTLL